MPLLPTEMAELLQLNSKIEHITSLIHLNENQSRHKRETIDHITDIIQEIQVSLENLETSFLEHDEILSVATINNASTNSDNKIGAKCYIETNGQVNCSDVIYEDERSWKKSRHQIDLLIKVLKNKINSLKDIRKHLKENKPIHAKDFDDSLSIEDDDVEVTSSTDDGFRSTLKFGQNNSSGPSVPILMSTEGNLIFSMTDFDPIDSSSVNPLEISSIKMTIPLTTMATNLRRTGHRSKGNRTNLNTQRIYSGEGGNIDQHRSKDIHLRRTTKIPRQYIQTNSTLTDAVNKRRQTSKHTTTSSPFFDELAVKSSTITNNIIDSSSISPEEPNKKRISTTETAKLLYELESKFYFVKI